MKPIILLHCVLIIIATTLFVSLAVIDKHLLEKASLSHHPDLMFSHQKSIFEDGGSISWESLMYSAYENREMKMDGSDDFRGTRWTWKLHNLLWIWLVLGGSFIGSMITYLKAVNRTMRPTELRVHGPVA